MYITDMMLNVAGVFMLKISTYFVRLIIYLIFVVVNIAMKSLKIDMKQALVQKTILASSGGGDTNHSIQRGLHQEETLIHIYLYCTYNKEPEPEMTLHSSERVVQFLKQYGGMCATLGEALKVNDSRVGFIIE